MTQDFAQETINTEVNIFGSTVVGSYAEPMLPPGFEFLTRSLTEKNVPWQINLSEFRSKQAQADSYERSYAGWASSTADPRYRGYLITPTLTIKENQAFGGTAGTGGVYFSQFLGELVIAQGQTANRCLYADNTDSAVLQTIPLAKTYNPGSAISALFAGPIGGATSQEYLFVGRTGATVDVHSAVGTTAGTAHANLIFCCGAVLSPVNATTPGTPTWIFLANNGLWTLPVTSAIAAAPTQTASNLPNGGCVFGLETLTKSPDGQRGWGLLPLVNLTTTAWDIASATTAPTSTRLFSFNEDGADVQYHATDLEHIYGGRLWRRKVVVHSNKRAIAYDGVNGIDLGVLNNESTATDIVAIGGDDAHLRLLLQTSAGLHWVEYNEAAKSWSTVSEVFTSPSSVSVSDAPPYTISLRKIQYGPSMPFSRLRGGQFTSLYNSSEVTWAHQWIPALGENHFISALANTVTSHQFATSAIHTFPAWTLPGRLAGHPFRITEIDGRLFDLESGGTDASVKFEVAVHSSNTQALSFTNTPISRTFTATDGVDSRIYRPQEIPLYRLQVRITLTAGTGATSKSPNGSGGIIRGVSFID